MTVVDGEVDAGTATISGAILVRSPGFEDSTGIPGIPDHGVLTGRDDPDQHPASAIDVDGTPLDQVLADLPGGGSAVTADFVLGVDAVDGTGDAFSLLLPSGDATGFTVVGALDAAGFAGFLAGYPDGATVAVPAGDHPGVYTVAADTLTEPWTQVAGTLVATAAGAVSADWLAAVIPDAPMRTLYPSPEVRAANLTTPPPLVDSGKWLLTNDADTSYASCPVPGPLTGLDARFKVAARAPLPAPSEPGEKRYIEFCTIPYPDLADLDLLEIAFEWNAATGVLGHYAEFHRDGDPVVNVGEYAEARIQALDSDFRMPVGHAWEGAYTVDPAAGVVAFWLRVLDHGEWVTADGRHYRAIARKTVAPFALSSEIVDGAGVELKLGLHDGPLAFSYLEVRDGIDGDLWANLPLTGTTDDAENTWTFHGDATVVDASLAAIGTGGGGVALGETSSTAYRGDRGKTAYDHSQVVTGNPHGTTAAGVGAAPTSHTHAASAIASGTIDIARIPTGTTSTTVPFGNDSRFSDKVPLSTVDAAGDLLIGTANDTVGRLPIGTARKVLTSDGSTASWANAAGPSPAMYPVAVGQWFANPHESIFAQTTTLNRALYVPIWIPADVTAVDGIQIEVTTVGSTGAVVRLGLHLPHATTKFPDARLIDGGTVDATSGGGAAGVRSLTIATTPVTPNSLAYVTVVSQGATATLRYANSGLWLLAMGVPSATNTDCMKASSNFGWFEAGVSGGFGTTASPTYSSSTAAQVVVGLRRA